MATLPRRPAALLAVTSLLVLALVAAASAGSAGPPGAPPTAATYRFPLDTAEVVHRFEAPPHPWAAGHRGVDLASFPGATVLAPVAGVVTFSGAVAGRRVVTVTDVSGRRSSVEPLVPVVRVGDLVSAGTRLGTVAGEGSHCAPSTCLHWGVRVGTDYVDPLSLLPGAGPVVLLPLVRDRADLGR